jgi:hypothetical protein
VTDIRWSSYGGADCIRLVGVAGLADPAGLAARAGLGQDAAVGVAAAARAAGVEVRPVLDNQLATDVAAAAGGLPATAGRLVRDGADVCFVPRFTFVSGTSYAVAVGGITVAVLLRPGPDSVSTTRVLLISPTAAQVPQNLLRCYIWFSAPMSQGYAARHVRLVDDMGAELAGALLPTDELWDGARRRLTVLLDPARIKRGLVGHRELGYPLRSGEPFRLVVDDGFRDAGGNRMLSPAERRYLVGPDERRRVDPSRWALAAPARGTRDPVEVAFDRPLDRGLLGRCLSVTDSDGRGADGAAEIGRHEMSWRLVPTRPWADLEYELVVAPVLEDLAGNSVGRVFDRDLTRHDSPAAERPVKLTFRPFHPNTPLSAPPPPCDGNRHKRQRPATA